MGKREDVLRNAVEFIRRVDVDPDSAGGAVALSYLLEPDAPHQEPDPGGGVRDEAPTDPAGRIAGWLEVEDGRVKDVVEFTESDVLLRLPTARLPRAKADRQRLITLLKLALDRVAFGLDEVSAHRINAACHEYACADQNLPHNVASRGDLVTRRGKRGSYVYRATQPGIERARALLVELFNDDTELRV